MGKTPVWNQVLIYIGISLGFLFLLVFVKLLTPEVTIARFTEKPIIVQPLPNGWSRTDRPYYAIIGNLIGPKFKFFPFRILNWRNARCMILDIERKMKTHKCYMVSRYTARATYLVKIIFLGCLSFQISLACETLLMTDKLCDTNVLLENVCMIPNPHFRFPIGPRVGCVDHRLSAESASGNGNITITLKLLTNDQTKTPWG